MLLVHFNYQKFVISEKDIEYLSQIVWKNEKINNYIKQQIYMTNTLKNIQLANKTTDKELINQIVQVGEFKIEN